MCDTKISEHLAYTEDHEWLSQDSDISTIGITDYAQSELGDFVFVELPEIGSQIQQGEPFGTIEAVKTVEDLIAPSREKSWRSTTVWRTAPNRSTRTPTAPAG